MGSIESGELSPPTAGSPAPIAYIRAIGIKAGDVEQLTIAGPRGQVVAAKRSNLLTSNRAQQMIFNGRRSRAGDWVAGTYTTSYSV